MTALILGATSPIARATAVAYAKAGYDVFVAARDADEAADIAADLHIRHRVRVGSGAFDAVELDAHKAFVDRVEEELGDIEVAVLAFGDMGDQEESTSDPAAARRVIDVNYTGAVSICEALAGAMEPRGRGAIVGISSVAGDRGRASNYIYGSAKGALTLYLSGLRNRLHKAGVQVMTVKLGFVDTRMTFGMRSAIPVASPETVGMQIRDAQLRGEDVAYLPRFWGGIMRVIRAIPEPIFKRLSL